MLFHHPAAIALYHGHNNLFGGRIAVTEHQQYVGILLSAICISARYAHLVDAATRLLLSHKLAVAIYQLRAVIIWQAISKLAPLEKVSIITFYQVLVIALSRQRGKLLSAGAATRSPQKN